jgi:hypothetical protein
MVEACKAEVIALSCSEHSLVREECERVSFNKFAYLLYRVAVADEFLRSMHIHTIEASVLEWSTCNTHMNF